MIEEAHYQYPHDTTDADKIIHSKLAEYREGLEHRLEALVPDSEGLKELCGFMEDREIVAELVYSSSNGNEYLAGVMENRVKISPSMNEIYQTIGNAVDNVNEHVMDKIDDNSIMIAQVPRSKKELQVLMRKIDQGRIPGDTLNDGMYEPSASMDLRVSASEEKLRLGTSDADRISFLKNINNDQLCFKDKMARLRQKEVERKQRQKLEKIQEKDQERTIYHEQVEERLHNSTEKIQERQRERMMEQKHYEEFQKIYKVKKPEFEKIRESYERDVLGPRKEQSRKVLQKLKEKVQPINYEDLDEHMKRYDADKRINEIKKRRIYGTQGASIALNTGERHFQNMVKNKEADENFQMLIRRREAAMKYASEVTTLFQVTLKAQKHFQPQVRANKEENKTAELPRLNRRQIDPIELKRQRYEIGSRYLQEAKEYQRNLRDNPPPKPEKPEPNHQSETNLQAGPVRKRLEKHIDYLKELRGSKSVKRDLVEWEHFLENREFEKPQDKFEVFKAELERRDIQIGMIENLRKCGADKNSKP